MPEVNISIKFTPKELRDQILTQIRTKDGGSLADVYDSLINSLEKQGLDDDYIKEFMATQFLDVIKGWVKE